MSNYASGRRPNQPYFSYRLKQVINHIMRNRLAMLMVSLMAIALSIKFGMPAEQSPEWSALPQATATFMLDTTVRMITNMGMLGAKLFPHLVWIGASVWAFVLGIYRPIQHAKQIKWRAHH